MTLQAQAESRPLQEILFEDAELQPWLEKLTDEQRAILRDPAKYLGAAVAKTERVCDYWAGELGLA
jgi:hypothetical protein